MRRRDQLCDRPRARGGLTKRFGTELRFDEVMRCAVRISTAAKRQKGETLREEEKMKILGIDRARSKSGEIVLIIDPQLTPEVFEKFRELWNADDFSISSGSLEWTGPAHNFVGRQKHTLQKPSTR